MVTLSASSAPAVTSLTLPRLPSGSESAAPRLGLAPCSPVTSLSCSPEAAETAKAGLPRHRGRGQARTSGARAPGFEPLGELLRELGEHFLTHKQ